MAYLPETDTRSMYGMISLGGFNMVITNAPIAADVNTLLSVKNLSNVTGAVLGATSVSGIAGLGITTVSGVSALSWETIGTNTLIIAPNFSNLVPATPLPAVLLIFGF